jgi:hypothetical protein
MHKIIFLADVVWDGQVGRGGQAMLVLQWLCGLKRLGHDVLLLNVCWRAAAEITKRDIGLASVYLANRFPNAQILALEVDAQNFELLVKNTLAYPQIKPLPKGLWNHRAKLAIEVHYQRVGCWEAFTRIAEQSSLVLKWFGTR